MTLAPAKHFVDPKTRPAIINISSKGTATTRRRVSTARDRSITLPPPPSLFLAVLSRGIKKERSARARRRRGARDTQRRTDRRTALEKRRVTVRLTLSSPLRLDSCPSTHMYYYMYIILMSIYAFFPPLNCCLMLLSFSHLNELYRDSGLADAATAHNDQLIRRRVAHPVVLPGRHSPVRAPRVLYYARAHSRTHTALLKAREQDVHNDVTRGYSVIPISRECDRARVISLLCAYMYACTVLLLHCAQHQQQQRRSQQAGRRARVVDAAIQTDAAPVYIPMYLYVCASHTALSPPSRACVYNIYIHSCYRHL